MSGSIGRGIFKGAAVVSLFLMLGKVMGFVQKVVIAKEFGTGSDADAFAYAYGSIVFTLLILPHKLLAPFLSLFVQRKEEQGERAAWQSSSPWGLLPLVLPGVPPLLRRVPLSASSKRRSPGGGPVFP